MFNDLFLNFLLWTCLTTHVHTHHGTNFSKIILEAAAVFVEAKNKTVKSVGNGMQRVIALSLLTQFCEQQVHNVIVIVSTQNIRHGRILFHVCNTHNIFVIKSPICPMLSEHVKENRVHSGVPIGEMKQIFLDR